MKKSFLLLLLFILSFASYSQTVTYDTSFGGWKAIVTRHVNHWQNDSVQGIIFFPGKLEVGNDWNLLRKWGPHHVMILTGWDGSVVLGNGIHYPVIISLQPPNLSTASNIVRQKIDIILSTFKIRRSSLHLTGISAGGSYATKFPMYKATITDNSYADMINSMWIVQGENAMAAGVGAQTIPWPQRYGWWSKNFRGRLVYMGQSLDTYRQENAYCRAMNDSMPGSAANFSTSFGNGGHEKFDETYYPDRIWTLSTPDVDSIDYRNTATVQTTPATSTACSWIQWLLRNGDTTLAASNTLPVVTIANVSPITLPTNSVNLNGNATDADGTITSYLWEKVSGPTGGVFGSISNAVTTYSNLVAGSYVLKLTATDNSGGSTNAQVTVIVNSPPAVSAGADIDITLPANSVTLNGSASDPDGSIVSYLWTKQSGGAATIASPNAATTVISGLAQGTYVFTLTVQDNHDGTAQDQVTVTVSGAPPVTRVINVTLDNVANYFKDPAWNSWHVTGNILSPVTSQPFKYADGAASTVTASITRQVLNNDNTVSYTGFAGLPDSALRYVSAHSNQRTLTIDGLDNAKSYSISLYSSRNAAGFTTKFTHGSTIIRIPTSGNKTAVATFSDIIPTSGQIVIQIDSAAGSTNRYNHLNAFVITETPLIACAADAGPDIVAARGTGMVTLDGSSSFGGTGIQYKWTLLNTVDFDWKACIKKGNQKVATTQILPYVDGGYNFELAVSDNNGCIAKDTLNVMLPWGTLPPQSANTNGWKRLLPGEAATINAVKGAGYAKADDIMIEGANAGTITGGKIDINLVGVSGLTIGPGTKIFIKAGNYRNIRMVFTAGQVAGSIVAPIIITNYDGQVSAQTFTMSNIKNAKMTGQYIAGVSGDANFKGHADGNYAWSRGAYGFFLTMIGYPLVPQVSGLPGPPPIAWSFPL